MSSLAVKYRPQSFDEVVGQPAVKIFKKQVETGNIPNTYMLIGASGCGKTTCARILANSIDGQLIEIDGASNNGVDNVRDIIKAAQERAIGHKYKVFNIDECQMITAQGWASFLKCIEECPKYTIFIFCTTDPQKVPEPIKNRCQRFYFNKIKVEDIIDKLKYISSVEYPTIKYEDEVITYLAKVSNGCMREAISLLERCFSNNIFTLKEAIEFFGNYKYDTYFNLTNYIIDGKQDSILKEIDNIYYSGTDLKLFVEEYLKFCIEVNKYIIFKDIKLTTIPSVYEKDLINIVNLENVNKYYLYIIDKLLELKNMLKLDNNPKSTIEIIFLQLVRGI